MKTINTYFIVSLVIILFQCEMRSLASELRAGLPIQRISGQTEAQGSFDTQMLFGTNIPTPTFSLAKEFQGFGQSIYISGLLSRHTTLVSYERNSLATKYQRSYNYQAKVQRLKFGYMPTTKWILGLGFESFDSEGTLQSIRTSLSYHQPLLITVRQWQDSWLLVQLATRSGAKVQKTDSSSGAKGSRGASISTSTTIQFFHQNHLSSVFADMAIDTADAFSSAEEKPNQPLRQKIMLRLNMRWSTFISADYIYMRNRDFLMNISGPFTHPFNTIGAVHNIRLATNFLVRFGLTTDLGGLLNTAKQRRSTVVFGFNYEN